MNTIWLAQMPDCFGYGLCVLDTTEQGALDKLRREYKKLTSDFNTGGMLPPMAFDRALEYFGGGVQEVEIGKSYYDGFKL